MVKEIRNAIYTDNDLLLEKLRSRLDGEGENIKK